MADTYFDECVLVADQFIRTVCFVDDQPFFQEVEDPTNEDIDHRLNANLITKAFASKGKSSTFYRYQRTEEEEAILKLVNNSDVTVLDWKIVLSKEGKEQSTAVHENKTMLSSSASELLPQDRNVSTDILDERGDACEEKTTRDIAQNGDDPVAIQTLSGLESASEEEHISSIPSDGEEDVLEDESRGKYAIMLLEKILTQRHASPKLILIYTAETDFETIFQAIHEKLNALQIVHESDSENLCFQNEKVRISIYFKQPNEVNGKHISDEVKRKKVGFSNLPEIVNKEFALINDGLISNIAIKSLTAIRDQTNQILNTFGQLIDPAFLAHRSLLAHPDDSEEHILDIIGSEIKSIIKGSEKGYYLSNDLIKKYIEHNFEDKDYDWNFDERDKFTSEGSETKGNLITKKTNEIQTISEQIPVANQDNSEAEIIQTGINTEKKKESILTETDLGESSPSEQSEDTKIEVKDDLIIPEKISRNDIIKFSEIGIDNIYLKRNTPLHQKILFSKNCHKSLTSLFSKNNDEAIKSNILLAILTTIKSRYNDNTPMLTQGTILKHNKEYWICIQPKCDTVRIPKTRGFLLASLISSEDSSKFDIVLEDEGEYKYFKIDYVTYKAKLVTFTAERQLGIVKAILEKDKFVVGTNPKMDWLGELRNDYAQSISNNFAAYLSRVGMDHSEWLRRSS